jgi:hypothetical protein
MSIAQNRNTGKTHRVYSIQEINISLYRSMKLAVDLTQGSM